MTIHVETPEEFGDRLRVKLYDTRFPFSGTIELTWACNLACSHCYLRSSTPGKTLSGDIWRGILDEIAAAGCVGIAFTGGEALLHPDYESIHAHAVRSGFMVSLFTNGSLVDEATADFLAAHPPRAVEISLYGCDRESYGIMTGDADAFDRVVRGLELLRSRKVDVILKAMLTRDLLPHVEGMYRLADGLGLELGFDPNLDPTLEKDLSPIAQRVDPEEAVRIEMSGRGRRMKMAAYDRRTRECTAVPRDGACGAGFSSFHIDPSGDLMPCLMLRENRTNIVNGKFSHSWKQLSRAPLPVYDNNARCRTCKIRHLCGYCPGLEAIGEVPPDDDSGFHCRIARARARALLKEDGPEGR